MSKPIRLRIAEISGFDQVMGAHDPIWEFICWVASLVAGFIILPLLATLWVASALPGRDRALKMVPATIIGVFATGLWWVPFIMLIGI